MPRPYLASVAYIKLSKNTMQSRLIIPMLLLFVALAAGSFCLIFAKKHDAPDISAPSAPQVAANSGVASAAGQTSLLKKPDRSDIGSSNATNRTSIIKRLYSANTLKELSMIASFSDYSDPDAVLAVKSAERICNYLGNATDKGRSAMMDKYGNNASFQYFQARRKRFCSDEIDNKPASALDLEDSLPEAYDKTSDKNFKDFLDIKYQTNAAPQSADDQKAALTGILKSTDSPYLLQQTGELLVSKYGVDWTGNEIAVPFGESTDSAKVTETVGFVLASCAISGGCGPGQWKTLQYCMPFECGQDTTVESYFQSRLTGSQYQQARNIADKVLEWRSSR